MASAAGDPAGVFGLDLVTIHPRSPHGGEFAEEHRLADTAQPAEDDAEIGPRSRPVGQHLQASMSVAS
jgi:hypothetical protein